VSAYQRALAELQKESRRLFQEPLPAELIECLADPARAAESVGALHDMRDRLGYDDRTIERMIEALPT
jgi:hypothetical protein